MDNNDQEKNLDKDAEIIDGDMNEVSDLDQETFTYTVDNNTSKSFSFNESKVFFIFISAYKFRYTVAINIVK